MYVGIGCVFNMNVVYGYDPSVSQKETNMAWDCWPSWCFRCYISHKKTKESSKNPFDRKNYFKLTEISGAIFSLEEIKRLGFGWLVSFRFTCYVRIFRHLGVS